MFKHLLRKIVEFDERDLEQGSQTLCGDDGSGGSWMSVFRVVFHGKVS